MPNGSSIGRTASAAIVCILSNVKRSRSAANGPMAACGRAHLIKATVLIGIVLLLLNVYNLLAFRRQANSMASVSLPLHNSYAYAIWPRRSHVRPNDTARHNKSVQMPTVADTISPPVVMPNASDAETTMSASIVTGTSVFPVTDVNQSTESHPMPQPKLSKCPMIPPYLVGPIETNTVPVSLEFVEQHLGDRLRPGGWYSPSECSARERVAIVVPYRNRAVHLGVFMSNLHPLLQRQQIDYGIFIVEQTTAGQFNRAALMNVGFVEAMKLSAWDCFIFHDLDLLPLDDRNLYRCPDQPRHMSVAVDTFGFKLPYTTIFGGVSALTVQQFRRVNGFSNKFWGWGGEDDDMSNRLQKAGYHIARYPINIARYTMLAHNPERANPKRLEILVSGPNRFKTDGLNSMRYKVERIEMKVLYTWILAEILPEPAS